MRKITLNLEELAVESFETAGRDGDARGTVRANDSAASEAQTQCGAYCPSGPYPCERSYAFTDGIAVCQCADTTGRCID